MTELQVRLKKHVYKEDCTSFSLLVLAIAVALAAVGTARTEFCFVVSVYAITPEIAGPKCHMVMAIWTCQVGTLTSTIMQIN